MKMRFKFLGGADMVGRMGMTMEGDGMTVLVEYGLSPTKPPEFPLQAPKIDYMFLTHSHLDHCGMVPQVVGRDRCDLFTTPLTAEISELMMKDTLKIAKAEDYVQPYSMDDIEKTMQSVVPMTYGDDITINHVDVSMLDAGHIPGAAMFEFSRDCSTIYSGDIHTEAQRLVGGAKPKDCTNLFIEGTYGGRNHPPRKQTEDDFIAKIDEVIDRGGTVLIPCFSVGRTGDHDSPEGPRLRNVGGRNGKGGHPPVPRLPRVPQGRQTAQERQEEVPRGQEARQQGRRHQRADHRHHRRHATPRAPSSWSGTRPRTPTAGCSWSRAASRSTARS